MITIKEIREIFREMLQEHEKAIGNVCKTRKTAIRPDIRTSSITKAEA